MDMSTPIQLLKNYLQDVAYHVDSCNLPSLNTYTSGTPEFSNLADAKDYVANINDAIDTCERIQGGDNPRARSLSILLEQERGDYNSLKAESEKLRSLLDIAQCMMDRKEADLLTQHAEMIGINLQYRRRTT